MKLSDLNPTQDVKQRMLDAGVTTTVYAEGERPTTDLPDVFIDLSVNGGISRLSTDRRLYRSMILVAIHTKLLATGAMNKVKELMVLKEIESVIDGTEELTTSPNNTVYSGKNVVAKYSSLMLNVNYRLY